MTNKIAIMRKDIQGISLALLFLWVVIVLIGVCEYGYLRKKQKEFDKSLELVGMNIGTHRH